MAEPQDITLQPDGSVVPLTWAETGSAVEPSAGRKGTGEIPGDIYTSDEHNWLTREGYRWLRALFSRYPKASELFFASWLPPTGGGIWSTNGVGALEAFLSDDPAGPDVVAADLWLDPDSRGAVRLQASVTKATPHAFPATQDTYVFAPIDVVAPPTITEPELTYLSVNVGDPQPATPAGTVRVWRVETDALTVVDQEVLIPTIPVLNNVGIMMLSILNDLEVGGTATFNGPASFNDLATFNAGLESVLGETATVNGDLVVGGLGSLTCNGDADFMNDVTLGDLVGDAITVNGTMTTNAPVLLSAGALLAGNEIEGSAGSVVDVETVEATTLALDDAPALPTNPGEIRRVDTVYVAVNGNSEAVALADPLRGYQQQLVTPNFITNTTASAIRRALPNEPIIVSVSCRYEISAVPNDLNYNLDITGPLGTVTADATAVRSETAAAGYSFALEFRWIPTTDFPAEVSTQSYTFLVRLGTTGGTVTADNISLSVTSGLKAP